MRSVLTVAVVLGLTSWAGAAERPRPPESFAPVAAAVKAAVVTVVMPDAPVDLEDDGDADDGAVLRRLFEALTSLRNRTLGAAVIVDSKGVAVTGSHLLRGATEVEVVTIDGRRHPAAVIGRDDRADVAVLRIGVSSPMAAARFGDSDDVRVGDWVLAVGSPYGFEASISAGIVSARARVSAGGPYADLIQTDAAINHGSAGGPLLNVRGEVIALAATAAPRGAGIAFAVPSNVVRTIVADILTHGHVIRSWIGIAIQPLTTDLATALRAPAGHGLVVADLALHGPAARAGIARRDIVLAFEGALLRNEADLERALARVRPGERRFVDVWSDGRMRQVSVVLDQEPDQGSVVSARRFQGLVLVGVTPEIGVAVDGVRAGTPADRAGFLRGDVLREIDGVAVGTLADFDREADAVRPDRRITVLVQRRGAPLYLVLLTERLAQVKELRR